MKKRIIFLIVSLFLIANQTIFAQQGVFWKENGLRWEDFRGRPEKLVDYGSQLYYLLGYAPQKSVIQDIKVIRFVTYASVDANKSWAKTAAQTDDNLRYNQTLFDIVEYNKRQLQYQIDKTNDIFALQQVLEQQNQVLHGMMENFNKSCNDGKDTAAVRAFSAMLKEELSKYDAVSVPKIQERAFGVFMNFGFGFNQLNGSVHNHFSNSPNLGFGFDFWYKKSCIFVNGSLGAKNDIKKQYIQSNQNVWSSDSIANFTVFEFAYGYKLWERKKHSLTPYAGLGVAEFSTNNFQDPKRDFTLVNYGITFGLVHEYTLSKALNLTVFTPFSFGNREINIFKIKSHLSFMPLNYSKNLKGTTINFGVTINFGGTFAKLIP